uniref:AlNc14C46G3747 protein n=1 Tax=Albugo laibachii Nc14 TaxID=890382 RepID=F0WAN3_9STRA|nr:AlNc14C46G3747 [Albugo laibachii Nc14]|eukprot:CCA18204.1 AlNc14C46G3747 [Albugo laibachii Nc14]
MERFGVQVTLLRVDESGFVNMEETAVFFETRTNLTVSPKGDRTIAILCSNSNTKRTTISVSYASDGTKLPLKGNPGGRIDHSINDELTDETFGCYGEKEGMDERSCRVWLEKINSLHVDAMVWTNP